MAGHERRLGADRELDVTGRGRPGSARSLRARRARCRSSIWRRRARWRRPSRRSRTVCYPRELRRHALNLLRERFDAACRGGAGPADRFGRPVRRVRHSARSRLAGIRSPAVRAPPTPVQQDRGRGAAGNSRWHERGLDVVRVRARSTTPVRARPTTSSRRASRARSAEIEAGRARSPACAWAISTRVRDFLDVDDVLDAYLRGCWTRPFRPNVYNVARGEGASRCASVLDTLLLELFGRRSPKWTTDPERMRPTDQLIGDASAPARVPRAWRAPDPGFADDARPDLARRLARAHRGGNDA